VDHQWQEISGAFREAVRQDDPRRW